MGRSLLGRVGRACGAALAAASGLLLAPGTTGCGGGCNYSIEFMLHATIVDAATGQTIPSPTFVDAATGLPIPSPGTETYAGCDTPEAGACASWTVSITEGGSPGGITIGAAGYNSRTVTVPGDDNRCANSGDEVTETIQLTKS